MYSGFKVSSPDCTLYTASNRVITALEGADSHVPYIIGVHVSVQCAIGQETRQPLHKVA